ncbi:hypothetical protein BDK51DRAFT_14460, partial [Blyttiomyces helicus]
SSTSTSCVMTDEFSPLERILLTANGTVQRILSAFWNATVTVEIITNARLDETAVTDPLKAVFRREVNIRCRDNVVCNAKSTITITDPEHLRLIEEELVGIGQLFRYLNVLPEFELVRAGQTPETFWRDYELRSAGIACRIHEEFYKRTF